MNTVNVLAEMQDCIDHLRDTLPAGDLALTNMVEARAAVAELIEAVEAAVPPIGQLDRRSNRGRYELDEDQMVALYDALARVGGAK